MQSSDASRQTSVTSFRIHEHTQGRVIHLESGDGTNRLTKAAVTQLTESLSELATDPLPLIITGSDHFFSAGADLHEIATLTGSEAYGFAQTGQALMNAIAGFPATVVAAIRGYCMGGGLDLALACHRRIAAPNAVFGHRGAALGLITGWGGTQRLPRLVGRSQALRMFLPAEKLHAEEAVRIGLIDQIADDPVAAALAMLTTPVHHGGTETRN